MRARWVIVLAALAILAIFLANYLNVFAAGDEGGRVEFISPNGSVTTVYVEIADTPREREQGLMDRASLGENNGMLFIFEDESPHYFWMKNTPLPLDMVFVNSNMNIVGINNNAKPYSLNMYSPGEGSRYVVEVNGGFCDRHGIGTGDGIKIYLKANSSAVEA